MANFNRPFYLPEETLQPTLPKDEVRLLKLSGYLHTLCFIVCIAAPLYLACHTLFTITKPAWKIDQDSLQGSVHELEEHLRLRTSYTEAVSHLNQRIRMDQVATALINPTPQGIILDSIQYQTAYQGSKTIGVVSVAGQTNNPDTAYLTAYIHSVETQLQTTFPDRTVTCSLENTILDKKAGRHKFSFNGYLQ
jgi:hypothetical protein